MMETIEKINYFIQRRLQIEKTINAMMEMQVENYDIHKQSITLSFPVKAWQLNPAGNMHGGMISSAMDIAMGCASYVFSKATFTPTIHLSINFTQPIKEGDKLMIQSICDHAGSRMAQTRAIAYVDDIENVVASANGSYAINT